MKKVAAWIMAVMFILFGAIVLFLPGTDTSGEPVDAREILRDDLEKNEIYYVEDLVIMDTFATLDDDVMYVVAMYRDEGGSRVAINMPINREDEIWDDVQDYMEDESMYIGDLTINCYVMAETDVDVEGKLRGYLTDWVDTYWENTGTKLFITDMRFDYICDEDGDPYAIAEAAKLVAKIVGCIVIAGGLLILWFGALRKPKKAAPAPKMAYGAVPVPPAGSTYQQNPYQQNSYQQSSYQQSSYQQNPYQQSSYQQSSYGPQPVYSQSRQSSLAQEPVTDTPAAPQTPAAAKDIIDQLNRFKALKDAGFMTDEEFEQKRRELLGL